MGQWLTKSLQITWRCSVGLWFISTTLYGPAYPVSAISLVDSAMLQRVEAEWVVVQRYILLELEPERNQPRYTANPIVTPSPTRSVTPAPLDTATSTRPPTATPTFTPTFVSTAPSPAATSTPFVIPIEIKKIYRYSFYLPISYE